MKGLLGRSKILEVDDVKVRPEHLLGWYECIPNKATKRVLSGDINLDHVAWCIEQAKDDPEFEYKYYSAFMSKTTHSAGMGYTSYYRFGPFFFFKRERDAMIFKLHFG